MNQKILNIGLPRTGTCSLNSAFKCLGYKSIHYPKNINIINEFEAAAEVSFSYQELENLYPNSLYIYTTRNFIDWVKSCHAHKIHKKPDWNPFWEQEKMWKEIHQQKEQSLDFFKNFPHRPLIMNICEGNGWEKLCPFLNRPTPNQLFPNINQSNPKLKPMLFF
jgi:hypothetical protein